MRKTLLFCKKTVSLSPETNNITTLGTWWLSKNTEQPYWRLCSMQKRGRHSCHHSQGSRGSPSWLYGWRTERRHSVEHTRRRCCHHPRRCIDLQDSSYEFFILCSRYYSRKSVDLWGRLPLNLSWFILHCPLFAVTLHRKTHSCQRRRMFLA